MPDVNITRSQAFYFFLLVIAFPLQYFLVEWTNKPGHLSGIDNVESVVEAMQDVFISYFSWKKWLELITNTDLLQNEQKLKTSTRKFSSQESVAKEVFQYRNPNGYFATSVDPRAPRPRFIKYRVGQVIKHKLFGYRGVIVGWDKTCHAPQHWIEANHKGHMENRHRPSYSVLVDVRDRPGVQSTYVTEDNIEVVTNIRIKHPHVNDYFNLYDGVQYYMRPALKNIYPFD